MTKKAYLSKLHLFFYSDIDECASAPCRNGATCTDLVNGYTCTCAPGWTGTHCETDINECISNPCVNGICSNANDKYFCTCNAGWTGTNCDTGKLIWPIQQLGCTPFIPLLKYMYICWVNWNAAHSVDRNNKIVWCWSLGYQSDKPRKCK